MRIWRWQRKWHTKFGLTPLDVHIPTEASAGIALRDMRDSSETPSQGHSRLCGRRQTGPHRAMCAQRLVQGVKHKYGGTHG